MNLKEQISGGIIPARKLISTARWTKTQWLDNTDIMQLLHVSRNTLQTWRSKNLIAYSQIGNKIFYDERDINRFMECNKHKVKKTNNKNGVVVIQAVPKETTRRGEEGRKKNSH